jgi:hypothetical protein
MTRLLAVLAVALMAGCQSPPLSPAQIASLDYGPRPDNYESLVRAYLKPRLNEPEYALIEVKAGPSPLYQTETLSRERQYGWAVCAMVNERDWRGTYGELYPVVVYIRNGKVVAADGGGLERAAGLRYAEAQCKRLGYSGF